MLHHKFPQLTGDERWDPRDHYWKREPQLTQAYLPDRSTYLSVCSYVIPTHRNRGSWSISWGLHCIQGHQYPNRPDLLAIIDRCFGDDPVPPGVFLDMFTEAL